MNATQLSRTLDAGFDETRARVVEALKVEGFGVLTEVDVKQTMKEKLDVEFPRYAILGACNPPLAHRALQAVPDIGVLLPCNVVVYEDDGQTVVATVDPLQTIASIGDDAELNAIAIEVRTRLERMLEEL